MTIDVLGLEISWSVLVLGGVTGLVYGLSGAGLVLVYRSNRIINFAHGQVGTLAASVLGLAVLTWHVPYWIAFAGALVIGGVVGAGCEAVVARRLRDSPVIVSVIATLGLSQVLFLVAQTINDGVAAGNRFPEPPGMPTFRAGALLVTPAYSAMLIITPLLVVALALFLNRGRLGISLRAASANADAARMSGIMTERMAGMAWAIAGALAAYTAVLVLPTRAFSGADFLGPGLLLRALVAAVMARMVSLPTALVAGVGVGVVEAIVLANFPSGGLVEAVLFVSVAGALLLQSTRGRSGRSEERGSWAAVAPWEPLPEGYRRVWIIRNLGRTLAGIALLAAIAIGATTTNATALALSEIAAFTLVGLSVGVLTGLAGQVSLGQFALAGVGATACIAATDAAGNLAVGVVVGSLAAGAVSLVLGLPALRIRGLMLAVTSMSFALAAQQWLFSQHWMLGQGKEPPVPALGGFRFDTGKRYYFFALAILVVGFWLARNVWYSGLGRRLRAVRDNEDAARAFSVSATSAKLQAFVIAGSLAGLGGVVYATSLASVSATAFPLDVSINGAATAVVGGLGLLAGPLLGTLYILGLPRFVDLDSALLAASAVGWLVLILSSPGGIAQALQRSHDGFIDALARRAGLDPATERSAIHEAAVPAAPVSVIRRTIEPPAVVPGVPAIEARDVVVRFGGITAVAGASIAVERGEIVGLIGPNGAGKTTLFEVISGFVRPASGAVLLAGNDITDLAPDARARLGLVRSFQDAHLFPTLSVLDAVAVAHERVQPTRLWSSLAGSSAADRRKLESARQLVGALGLHQYRHTEIRSLSTGTRRIVELACLVALEPSVLLLDEPTSGIAQRETEALGQLLLRIKAELDLTLVIIEHDIPLVTALADRIIALETGAVIADGSPSSVLHDPAVIEAYLGGDPRAIERSTHLPTTARPR